MGDGRVILVTGASSGIGREVAKLLAERGDRLYITARRAEALETLASSFPEGRVTAIAGDLQDEVFRRGLVSRVVDDAGRLDVLINNAGLSNMKRTEEISREMIATIINVNVVALMELTQDALRVMKQQKKGRIINVSSVLGHLPIPYSSVYVASKFAVNGFTEALRLELRGSGITVSAVCPGGVDTEFGDVAMPDQKMPKQWRGAKVNSVARGIVRQIDRRRVFIYPNLSSRLSVGLFRMMPWLLRFVMARTVRKQMDQVFGYDKPLLEDKSAES